MPRVRVRQHVNPLSWKYQRPIESLDEKQLYAQPQQPLYLDVGCARGKFLLEMAQQYPEANFLGLEIRQPLVQQANQDRDRLGLTNLHYLFANANFGLCDLLLPHSIAGVMIQFPDPWFKRRHQRRRLVQSQLVEDLARCLQPGGFVFAQSDVLSVAMAMRDRFTRHPAFHLVQEIPQTLLTLGYKPDSPIYPQTNPQEAEATPNSDWLPINPFPVPTEREGVTLEQGLSVYRFWLIKE
jgi:tRNA (guanine-N7-)-methyltransferase